MSAVAEPKPADQTLRDAVMEAFVEGLADYAIGPEFFITTTIDRIATLLEETGAPAYERVAKDLRGEWVG